MRVLRHIGRDFWYH